MKTFLYIIFFDLKHHLYERLFFNNKAVLALRNLGPSPAFLPYQTCCHGIAKSQATLK